MHEELKARIVAAKSKWGDRVTILGHHYQRREIVAFADHVGDSFKLARDAAASDAERIVFCGVYFMGESARILAKPNQRVFMPDIQAGCPMADMADREDAELAWARIKGANPGRKVVPITYVNSTADVKAFVGAHGGIVCTSSNAGRAFDWAMERGDLILFLPDEMLGTNTAIAKGKRHIALWDPHSAEGGVSDAELAKAEVVVWRGYCHVHTMFDLEDIKRARKQHPGATIVVHPECVPAVVDASDANGSTAFIVNLVQEARPGDTVVIGTEINLVRRLAQSFPEKNIVPLSPSVCPNMYKTDLKKLASLLETFNERLEITVDEAVARDARLALQRMMEL